MTVASAVARQLMDGCPIVHILRRRIHVHDAEPARIRHPLTGCISYFRCSTTRLHQQAMEGDSREWPNKTIIEDGACSAILHIFVANTSRTPRRWRRRSEWTTLKQGISADEAKFACTSVVFILSCRNNNNSTSSNIGYSMVTETRMPYSHVFEVAFKVILYEMFQFDVFRPTCAFILDTFLELEILHNITVAVIISSLFFFHISSFHMSTRKAIANFAIGSHEVVIVITLWTPLPGLCVKEIYIYFFFSVIKISEYLAGSSVLFIRNMLFFPRQVKLKKNSLFPELIHITCSNAFPFYWTSVNTTETSSLPVETVPFRRLC